MATDYAALLKDAITKKPYQAPQAIDNSGMINTQYGDLTAALKAQIQQNVNDKNMTIGGLGEKYQPDKNASEVAKYGQVATLNEQAANQGDRGGIGRQNTLQAMIGGENRLNTINLQQSGEKTGLQNDIANLMLEGNIQEAQFSAQKLKDLIANNTNMDNTNYSRGMDTANLTGLLGNGQKTMAAQQIDTSNNQWQQGFDQNAAQNTFNNGIQTAGLTGMYNGQQTMAGKAAELNNILTNLGIDTARFNYAQLPIEAQQKADQVANDLANGRMTRAQAQSSIDHAGDSLAASLASTRASSAANASQLAWAKSKDNPSNAPKVAKANPNANTINDYASTINSYYVTTDGRLDTGGVRTYLDSLINNGVDRDTVNSLSSRFGISSLETTRHDQSLR